MIFATTTGKRCFSRCWIREQPVFQLTYNDRALQFFRTFVQATEKENYFEVPPGDSWDFVPEESALSRQPVVIAQGADCSFAQPIVDPFSQAVVSWRR